MVLWAVRLVFKDIGFLGFDGITDFLLLLINLITLIH